MGYRAQVDDGTAMTYAVKTRANEPASKRQGDSASVKAPLLSGEGKEGVEKMDNMRERANSRVVENGFDVLDNNEVNFLMCLTMSLGAVAISAYVGDRSLWEVFSI